MPTPFAFDRTWELPAPAAEVWALLTRPDDFPDWWPWLRSLDVEGDGLVPGTQGCATVRGPLPYTLRFVVSVVDVVPEALVVAEVRGDLDGPARLELHDLDGGSRGALGCTARLRWRVELRAPALARVATVARPAMIWAHDRVVAGGMRTFRRAVLDGARGG